MERNSEQGFPVELTSLANGTWYGHLQGKNTTVEQKTQQAMVAALAHAPDKRNKEDDNVSNQMQSMERMVMTKGSKLA